MRIAIHTRQAGSTSAFIPVVRQLEHAGHSILIVSEDASVSEWTLNQVEPKVPHTFPRALLSGFNPDFMLTGTSLKVKEDAEYWNWARNEGIPCMAYVESWVNYKERFTVSNDFDCTPEIIGVPDQLVKNRFIELGYKRDNIYCLSNPRFDDLSIGYKEWLFKHKPFFSESKEYKVLILTNPALNRDTMNYESNKNLDWIHLILNELNDLQYSIPEKVLIVLKTHPREKLDFYTTYIDKSNYSKIDIHIADIDTNNLLFQSHLVIGNTTIILLDAVNLSIPTISFQPNKININDITDNRKGINVVKNARRLKKALKDLYKINYQKSLNDFLNQKKKSRTQTFCKFILSYTH